MKEEIEAIKRDSAIPATKWEEKNSLKYKF
jgi:hypothetical protein